LNRRLERGYRLVVDEGVPHDLEALEKARLAKTGALSTSPRFLFVHRAKKRFAWVEARGVELLHAQGPAADEATTQPTTKPCASEAAALRERDALVATLMAKGYELDTFGAKDAPKKRATKPLAVNDEIERAVAEDPYDDGAWAVLEDWILQQDDPRAELVRLAKANQPGVERQVLAAALPQLLGPKHAAVSRVIGLIQWRAGYIVECYYTKQGRGADAAAERFYEAPAARLIRKLDFELEPLARLATHLALIAKAPCRHALRHVEVLWSPDRQHTSLDTNALAAITKLTSLKIRSPTSVLQGSATLATLRDLTVAVATRDTLASWCAQTFPALQRLVLRFEDRSPARLVDELAPLLDGKMTPALERLHVIVKSRETTDALTAATNDCALRPRLRELIISPWD